MPNFTPSVQRVALRGEKPQNRPLSKLNTGRFALRAMLPVKYSSTTSIGDDFTACCITLNAVSMRGLITSHYNSK